MMVNLEKALGQLFLGERREGKGNRRYNPSNKMWGYFLRVSGLRNVVSVRDAIQEAKIRGFRHVLNANKAMLQDSLHI